MFTVYFWKATLERSLSTFAESLLAILSAGGVGLMSADWRAALSASGLAFLFAILKAVAASQVGGNASPSLANEVITGEPN